MLRNLLLLFTAVGLFSIFSSILMFDFTSDYHLIYFPQQNASLCACYRCIAEFEPGFTELYNKTPKLFLSLETNMSESAFNYWTYLLPWRATFVSYKRLLPQLFEMFPLGPELEKPSPDICRSCAVVGNSGSLRGTHYGPLIDHHDIVIRMNKAPTKGYERDVGTRTTHHVMFPYSATNLTQTTHLVFIPYKKLDLDWLIKAFSPRPKDSKIPVLQANKDLVMILNPEFIRHVHDVWLDKKGWYPSTGFLTLILSLYMCDEVDVFGFGADRFGNWDHYFEELQNKRLRTGNHPGNDELKVMKWLQQIKKINFFKG